MFNYFTIPGLIRTQESIFREIKNAVCDVYGLEEHSLFIPTRVKEVIKARHMYIYLILDIDMKMNKLHKPRWNYINRTFLNNAYNHATLIYIHKKISGYIDIYSDVRDIINEIKERANIPPDKFIRGVPSRHTSTSNLSQRNLS